MEILKEGASAWVLSEFEWRARWGASAVNIGNKILVMGRFYMIQFQSTYFLWMAGGDIGAGNPPETRDVHEFDPSTETFVKVGQMKEARRWFAVSVATSKDVIQHCL